jgi:hypothetical protein
MFILQTEPPPVFPSNVKKFAIGASRAARAFKISCAKIPPTTAQVGENSCAADVLIVLEHIRHFKPQTSKLIMRTQSNPEELKSELVG